MAGFSDGYALLIGVGGDLPATIRDVTEVGEVLRDPARAGYPAEQVRLVTGEDATRSGILEHLERLRQDVLLTPNATAIIYYSGHGVQLGPPGAGQRYFLVPHGFDLDRPEETGVRDAEFTEAIQALRARRLLVILDCCHAAGLPQLKSVATYPSAIELALSQGSGRVVLSSCKADEKSYIQKDGSLSEFTACLLAGLTGEVADAEGKVNVLELLAYVMREVPRRQEKQHPFVNRIDRLSENFPVCLAPTAKGGAGRIAPASTKWEIYGDAYKIWRDKVAYLAAVEASLAEGERKFEVQQSLRSAEGKLAEIERKLGPQ